MPGILEIHLVFEDSSPRILWILLLGFWKFLSWFLGIHLPFFCGLISLFLVDSSPVFVDSSPSLCGLTSWVLVGSCPGFLSLSASTGKIPRWDDLGKVPTSGEEFQEGRSQPFLGHFPGLIPREHSQGSDLAALPGALQALSAFRVDVPSIPGSIPAGSQLFPPFPGSRSHNSWDKFPLSHSQLPARAGARARSIPPEPPTPFQGCLWG